MANLYEGNAEAAEKLVTDAWPSMKKAMVFFIQQMKIRALHLRGCTRLANAAPMTARRAALLRLVERDADALEGEKVAWARALALLLRAGVSRLNDDSTKAGDDLERAIAALDAADMGLYAAAADANSASFEVERSALRSWPRRTRSCARATFACRRG